MSPRLFAVWLWPDTIAREGAETVAERLLFAGVTDIYLLTKGQSGAACFDTSKTALQIAWPGYDIFPNMCKYAHIRGMRVHAWLTSTHDAAYRALHPESGLCHYIHGRDRDIVNITDEAYRDYVCAFVRELFERCEPDGLHLDYIRYNHLTYGWGQEDRAAIKRLGVDLEKLDWLMQKTFFDAECNEHAIFDAYSKGDSDVRTLAEYRRKNVTSFARHMAETALSAKPEAILSAALMPEGAYIGCDMTNGVSGEAFAALHYGQSYADAAVLFHHVAIMSYAPTYGKSGAWVRHLAHNAMRVYGCRVMAGVQAYGEGTSETLWDDLTSLSALAGEEKYLGCALFRAGEVALCRQTIHGRKTILEVVNALPRPITELLIRPLENACILAADSPDMHTLATPDGLLLQSQPLLQASQAAELTLTLDAPSYLLVRVFCQEGEARALMIGPSGPLP